MIKLFKNGKLYQEYDKLNIKNIEDVFLIYKFLYEREEIKWDEIINTGEESMQWLMRQFGFTLQSY